MNNEEMEWYIRENDNMKKKLNDKESNKNYGNEAYHIYGSHGCIRVPVEASEFIYNTSPVGTMVLVNRK